MPDFDDVPASQFDPDRLHTSSTNPFSAAKRPVQLLSARSRCASIPVKSAMPGFASIGSSLADSVPSSLMTSCNEGDVCSRDRALLGRTCRAGNPAVVRKSVLGLCLCGLARIAHTAAVRKEICIGRLQPLQATHGAGRSRVRFVSILGQARQ